MGSFYKISFCYMTKIAAQKLQTALPKMHPTLICDQSMYDKSLSHLKFVAPIETVFLSYPVIRALFPLHSKQHSIPAQCMRQFEVWSVFAL